MIIGVGTNKNFQVYWQSPDNPSPTITTAPQKDCGGGWLLISMKSGAKKLTYKVTHENGGFKKTECTNIPSPTITATQCRMYIQESISNSTIPTENKPPYKVPSMKEIEAIEWNGYNVVSTFSGCGGSCLGYRMAGYRVLWANEFLPAAQNSYKANHPNSILDTRDIRIIQPSDILNAIGLKKGELDLFDGSPPCQAFSTADKREKNWGKGKKYENGVTQNNEDLFFEYIRILNGLQPKVFVAENVSGLVKGTAKGYFKIILKQLKDCGYNVKTSLLDAQWLGVPQARQRIIFIGIRNDIGIDPTFPKPLNYRYSVRDAIDDILKITFDPHGKFPKQEKSSEPSFTITVGNSSHVTVENTDNTARKLTIAELKRIGSFPDDFILTGSYAQQWERVGNSVPPVMMYHIAKNIRENILSKIKD